MRKRQFSGSSVRICVYFHMYFRARACVLQNLRNVTHLKFINDPFYAKTQAFRQLNCAEVEYFSSEREREGMHVARVFNHGSKRRFPAGAHTKPDSTNVLYKLIYRQAGQKCTMARFLSSC